MKRTWGCRVQGAGFRVWGSGCGVQGVGFRAPDKRNFPARLGLPCQGGVPRRSAALPCPPFTLQKSYFLDLRFTLPALRMHYAETQDAPYLGTKLTFGENDPLVQPSGLVAAEEQSGNGT